MEIFIKLLVNLYTEKALNKILIKKNLLYFYIVYTFISKAITKLFHKKALTTHFHKKTLNQLFALKSSY